MTVKNLVKAHYAQLDQIAIQLAFHNDRIGFDSFLSSTKSAFNRSPLVDELLAMGKGKSLDAILAMNKEFQSEMSLQFEEILSK
tara:strand:+ start:313 stop:564 length:252 start_codon:yes stop_codon:yes gene_type:complete